MLKQYSPRLLFTLAAITCLVISPLFAIFVPMTVPDLFLTDRSWFYIYSFKGNVKLIMMGFVLLAAAFALLSWKRHAATYVGCLALIIFGLVTLYSSTENYTAINETQVQKNLLIGSQTLKWSEIDEVVLEYVPGSLGQYIFKGKNGKEIIVAEDKEMATSYIYQMANKQDVPFNEYEKK
ncbi:ATP-dependent exonuclease [Solibacillus daqui]|uniref:ATP-dependent exonuclease n=1 Tax=Solibacillus daqui TaxID=2912187 RepID=UPI002366C5B0|nr:ATP-dependent exonuclease [Solibacillus daqui]